MSEAEDDAPISWKPLGAVVDGIVSQIRAARLSQLVRETVGPSVVTGERNRESGLRRTGQGKGRVLGDDRGI
jgi:hypothetical protein